MVSTSGSTLLVDSAVEVLMRRLIPRATLITPNLPEGERLLGRKIADPAAMAAAAADLLALGPRAVLLKGGHLAGPNVVDVLATAEGVRNLIDTRIRSNATHGTGCTLASAVAAGLAQGMALAAAVDRARTYLRRAIETAPGYGGGFGPVNHAHTIRPAVE
ncbi:MAG: bifunctional hydroxymethylpyrimidine kinase/phosphomethylpyrimidine kinase [Rhodospirillales bacterium]|nr:bifunctional hydroxymethylpyrimidine kinase/phosphomethylpyrimidine kinase [Rhodospirillales bacterium]